MLVRQVGPAPGASDRVGGAGDLVRGVVQFEAEGDAHAFALVGEGRDHRVVAVDDERGVRRKRGSDRFDRVGDGVDLAETVQLIAEQVRHEERPRRQLRRDFGQRALVHLDHEHAAGHPAAHAGVADRQARDALDEIRAGGIVAHGHALAAEQRGGETGRGRLAVAARDRYHRLAPIQDDSAQNLRIHSARDHARDRRAAPAPRQLSGAGRCLARREGQERAERE